MTRLLKGEVSLYDRSESVFAVILSCLSSCLLFVLDVINADAFMIKNMEISKMKIYKIFKKFMYVIDLFVVMICLYCWMINDFNSNLHDLGSKAIIVCVCVNLCCFIFEKKILSRSNK